MAVNQVLLDDLASPVITANKKTSWRTTEVVFNTRSPPAPSLTVQISFISSIKRTTSLSTSAQKIQQKDTMFQKASIILSAMVLRSSVLHTLAGRVFNSR